MSLTEVDPLERQLVERARVDADAFAELYRNYLPQVHGYAWRRTGSIEAAEDVCSATFELALRNLGSFRWRSGGFAPWLFRIAANQVIAHHRREGRSATDRGQIAMDRLHREMVEEDLAEVLHEGDNELREALAQLTPRYQRAIDLRYLADLSTEEAAQAAGMTKAAFSVVLSRALKALRKKLSAAESPPARSSATQPLSPTRKEPRT